MGFNKVVVGWALCGLMTGCSGAPKQPEKQPTAQEQAETFESKVQDYLKMFPVQRTYDQAMSSTEGQPANFNAWANGGKPVLVKAGEDKVVRVSHDAYSKVAFVLLGSGPVTLTSTQNTKDRFVSFQFMDERNVNYHNVISPEGIYTLYRGEKPADANGEAIAVPSLLSAVIVRVEVKDKNNAADVAAAKAVFAGIEISGAKPSTIPTVDVLSGFEADVMAEALERIEAGTRNLAYPETVVGPGQEPGTDVPFLNLAVGTQLGWGAPGRKHSTHEMFRVDNKGSVLDGNRGTFSVTTSEPPVGGLWSVTVYDTARGGFLHPNVANRHHINNTSAVKNADGTVTFLFKRSCTDADKNCLEVPPGPFDLATRYYLPKAEILNGSWKFPPLTLESN